MWNKLKKLYFKFDRKYLVTIKTKFWRLFGWKPLYIGVYDNKIEWSKESELNKEIEKEEKKYPYLEKFTYIKKLDGLNRLTSRGNIEERVVRNFGKNSPTENDKIFSQEIQ